VSDRTLFGCCDKYDDVEAVCVGGLHCGMKFLNSSLGQFHDDGGRQRISSSMVMLLAGRWPRFANVDSTDARNICYIVSVTVVVV